MEVLVMRSEDSSYLATFSCVTPYQASSVIKTPSSYLEKMLYR